MNAINGMHRATDRSACCLTKRNGHRSQAATALGLLWLAGTGCPGVSRSFSRPRIWWVVELRRTQFDLRHVDYFWRGTQMKKTRAGRCVMNCVVLRVGGKGPPTGRPRRWAGFGAPRLYAATTTIFPAALGCRLPPTTSN